MGTTYHITVVADAKPVIDPARLKRDVDELLSDFNQVMSTYIPDSELSRLNKAPVNAAVVVSPKLFDILNLSHQISIRTKGSFDTTVGPIVNLWGFGPEEREEKQPSAEQVAAARQNVGFRFVELEIDTYAVRKSRAVYIDLSAIAKGAGADEIAGLLLNRGIANYMIEVGGELHVAGVSPRGKPWRIGVEQPSLAQTGVAQAISIEAGGIATSGDYRNYFEIDGERFSHTIDPATAAPITHNLASVTVVANNSAEADAMATALNVMGPVKGYDFALKENIAAYFLVREDEAFTAKYTAQFEQYLSGIDD
ncbi:FAD:protein FMN transferase [Teredinibacter waterburyi]|jgi:Membrane-associated lipoprotein involved in thiamine biosynthesis|uniref:FAD:protein FMN transferase n=1 Tax=Teredinibacter waterburyi TaxID=1500538 RepID=UPI001FEAEA27|nr:FAD:protein FMN transferase [Teredinibacter waterburyi]